MNAEFLKSLTWKPFDNIAANTNRIINMSKKRWKQRNEFRLNQVQKAFIVHFFPIPTVVTYFNEYLSISIKWPIYDIFSIKTCFSDSLVPKFFVICCSVSGMLCTFVNGQLDCLWDVCVDAHRKKSFLLILSTWEKKMKWKRNWWLEESSFKSDNKEIFS